MQYMTMSLRCFLYATSVTNEANEVLNPSFRTAILLERDDAPDGAEEQAVTIGYLLPVDTAQFDNQATITKKVL
jgi:hypothetical protein